MASLEGSGLSKERPFPGLRPFDAADHDYFFGRENQVYALYRLVTRSHFSTVVGSSGSGKSSLVRAGLLPLLAKEAGESGGRNWIYKEMRPGDAPLERLIKMFCKIAADLSTQDEQAIATARMDRIAYRLRASSYGIVDALAEIPGAGDRSILLLIDQFEELFRFSTSLAGRDRSEEARQRDEAAHFVQLLLEASRCPDYDIRVLLTMRSDFIGDCSRFHGLPEAVSAAQFLAPALDRSQREATIRNPIAKADGSIDAVLVERLLNDSDDELDQLPVLQHCLLCLWECAGRAQGRDGSSGRQITLPMYGQIGGLAGALSGHANEILEKDLPNLTATVEHVFRALCEFDQQGRITRRALPFERLVAETGDEEADVRKVVDRLRADDCSFLTPPLSMVQELAPHTRIDVGHEALLRGWEKVSGEPGATGERDDLRAAGWLREERRDGQLYQVLLSMVDNDQPDQARIPSDQVDRFAKWWKKRPRTQAWTERWGGDRDAVDRLIKQSLRLRDEEEERRLADKVEQKRTRKLRAVLGGVCAALILVGGASVFIWTQYRRADAAATVAKKQAEAAGLAMSVAINAISDSYQRGAVTTESAAAMLKSIQEAAEDLPELTPLGATQKLGLLLTISDALKSLGNNQKAYDIAQRVSLAAGGYVQAEPHEQKYQILLYSSLFRLADATTSLNYSSDSLKKVLPLYQQAQDIGRQLAVENPGDGKFADNVTFVTNKVGETLMLLGDLDGARAQYGDALDNAGKLVVAQPANDNWKASLASTQSKMATLLLKPATPDLKGALRNTDAAIAIQKDLLTRHADDKVISSNLAGSYRTRGDVLKAMALPNDALQSYGSALDIVARIYQKDPKNTFWGLQLANSHSRIAAVLADQGNLEDAANHYRQAVVIWRDLTSKSPGSPVWLQQLKTAESKLAAVEAARQNPPAPAAPASVPDN
ncbi:hypothetical protein GCM10007874_51300 [Labrys miyagiensis]|uniref:Novel STAND NTPase 1 domain-containing protein n=1 Tax=Labrys miyagiensis TaxID=346912 RepID=A0ABQ6CP43_9HYPH|nr:tetratricopeptide repeat protein [Labrys miyagiensis]GLS22113.1 hypothetical protein GCM10007874_51300 [Labrys miyagiensis]